MAAIVASKVKRIRKQRDADSQQNLRTAAIQRGRGDSLFENGGEASPSSIRDKQNVVQRQVIQPYNHRKSLHIARGSTFSN